MTTAIICETREQQAIEIDGRPCTIIHGLRTRPIPAEEGEVFAGDEGYFQVRGGRWVRITEAEFNRDTYGIDATD